MKKGILILLFFYSHAMELQKEKQSEHAMYTIDLDQGRLSVNDQRRQSGAFQLDLGEIDSEQEKYDLAHEALICYFGEDHKFHCYKNHLAKKIEELQNSPHKDSKTTLNSLRQVTTVRKSGTSKSSSGNDSNNSSKVTRAPIPSGNATVNAALPLNDTTNAVNSNSPTAMTNDVMNVTGDVQKLVHDAIAAYNSSQNKQKITWVSVAGGFATVAAGLLTAYLNCKK